LLEEEKRVVPFCFQPAAYRGLIENDGLSVGGVMEELESNGGGAGVRPDEYLFVMM
jgi:hypothetical protein